MSSTTYNIVPGRYDRDLPISTKTHFISSAASTNATLVKSSPGTVFSILVHNTGSGVGHAHHLRLYDKNTAPVVGTDVPFAIIHLPASQSKEINFTSGITFNTGIAYSITEDDDLLDATPIEADSVQLFIGYM
jgi:hypothetical protein